MKKLLRAVGIGLLLTLVSWCLNGTFAFAAEYTLTLSQYNASVHGALVVPTKDTRNFSLNFINASKQNILQKSIPQNATKTIGTTYTTYSFDLGDISGVIAAGSYTVELSSDEPNPTNLVSASVNPITTTTLDLSKVAFKEKIDYQWPFSYTPAAFSGKITPPEQASSISHIYLQFATTQADLYASPKPIVDATKKPDVLGEPGINTDGTYYFGIPSNLSPNTIYYFRQIIETTAGGKSLSPIEQFTPKTGYTPGGTPPLPEKGIYNLLTKLPGLNAVLDPDVCAQLQSPGGPGLAEGQVCDINVYLNYMFKLLIGLGAVFLVFRLVIEGYNYIITDTPFKKSKARSGFSGALLGLLLALSAYLILNTINPKLVENKINIQTLNIGINRLSLQESKTRLGEIQNGSSIPTALATAMKQGDSRSVLATCYFIAEESEYGGIQDTPVFAVDGTTIAKVRSSFYKVLTIEGTGVLSDGRMVGFVSASNKDDISTYRFKIVQAPQGSWGTITPMKSIAVDPAMIAPGSLIFIPYFANKSISYYNGSTSQTILTDGTWQALDRGGAIKGAHIDLFTGYGAKNEQLPFCSTSLTITVTRAGK